MSSYIKEAKRRWGKESVWISGDGAFALLAWCRELTVTLWESEEEAKKNKGFIDDMGCGGYCIRNHEIIKLPQATEI